MAVVTSLKMNRTSYKTMGRQLPRDHGGAWRPGMVMFKQKGERFPVRLFSYEAVLAQARQIFAAVIGFDMLTPGTAATV
jgi:hypothetical protein